MSDSKVSPPAGSGTDGRKRMQNHAIQFPYMASAPKIGISRSIYSRAPLHNSFSISCFSIEICDYLPPCLQQKAQSYPVIRVFCTRVVAHKSPGAVSDGLGCLIWCGILSWYAPRPPMSISVHVRVCCADIYSTQPLPVSLSETASTLITSNIRTIPSSVCFIDMTSSEEMLKVRRLSRIRSIESHPFTSMQVPYSCIPIIRICSRIVSRTSDI